MRLAEGYLSRTGFRLPTESEWEFLCRAGTTTARYFGDSEELVSQYAWYNGNSQQHSWPVGHWKPNAFGLFDMLGNVFTWTQHTHVGYPVNRTAQTADQEQTLRVDESPSRVIRGGAFNRDGATLRSAARNMEHPEFRNFPIGFRFVRTYPRINSDAAQQAN
jgi:formylglycine-generating enzyme required for sulfatase activity